MGGGGGGGGTRGLNGGILQASNPSWQDSGSEHELDISHEKGISVVGLMV